MEENNVAVVEFAEDVGDDLACGNLAAVGFLPVVGVDFLADDDVTHVLGDGEMRDFLGELRLMVDAVGRTEENGFYAESAFDEALGVVELPLDLRRRKARVLPIGVGIGVIGNFVAFCILAPKKL